MKRLAVYCGSASPEDPRYVQLAHDVGADLAARGIGLVHGGGKLGLMKGLKLTTRLARGQGLAHGALAAAGVLMGFLAAVPAAAQEQRIDLPERVIDFPATAKRDTPRKMQHEGVSYDHFLVTLTLQDDDIAVHAATFEVYVDCRAQTLALVSSYKHGGDMSGTYIEERTKHPVTFEDQNDPEALLGSRNLKALCSLK